MDLRTLLMMLLIFPVAYGGIGLFLDSRRTGGAFSTRWRADSQRRSMLDLSTLVGRLALNQFILRIKGLRSSLDLLLMRAGHPFGWKAEDLLVYKEIAMAASLFVLWGCDMTEPVYWCIAPLISFWIPDLLLRSHASSRRVLMQRQLPGVVDLLALTTESGLDLLVALERILDKMKPGPLRDELQSLMQESRLGTSRRDVLERWAFRTGLSDAQSLASLVVQSEQMGSPLAAVLRNYAEDMRSRRILRAEELAGKIPVKILLPMMVFFFPIVFVIILGPVALDFFKNYK